jgi:DNA-binding transcriptional MerR regulator
MRKETADPMAEGIKIGELVKRTGVTRATVHHYVREGLLPEPKKTSRNMALYDPSCVDRVLLIKGLQAQTRRSLAEVKGLLEDATGNEGIGRLQDLLENEAMRAQVSPLNPEKSRSPLTLKQLCDRSGFGRTDIEEFCEHDLIVPTGTGRNRRFGPLDVAVVDALAGLREAGFDETHGFRPAHAAIYLHAMRDLLHTEISSFLATASSYDDPDELLRLAEMGIERVTPLMLALRRRVMHELIAATPLANGN